MPAKIERDQLKKLLRESLGLAGEDGAKSKMPSNINEPPVNPVVPKPSVDGSEVGNIKAQAAFETNPIMRKLGKLLSNLSDDQQKSVYKKLRSSTKKKKKTNEVVQLSRLIEKLINENPEADRRRAIAMSKLAKDLQSGKISDDDAIKTLTQQHGRTDAWAKFWVKNVKLGGAPDSPSTRTQRDPRELGMPLDSSHPDWKPSDWNKFKMGSHHPKPGDDDTSHKSGDWGAPSAEELEAIEQGDEGAGDYTPEEKPGLTRDDIPDVLNSDPPFDALQPGGANRTNTRREKYTKAELAKIDLMDSAHRTGVNALTSAEVIEAISAQVGVSRSAVTNILYDYMKKMGDDQRRRRPSERRAIPTSEDPEKRGTASKVEKMLYGDFREEMEGYGDMFPELAENPYPASIDDLPENDYRRELFRNYARLFLMTQYGDDIRSSVDLVADWHNLADVTGNPAREHGNGTPHSENASLHGFIVGDVRELMGNMNSSDFEQYLKRAQALIDADKTAGGQGWKGVVKKVDKEAEKAAKKKAKAAKKKK